MIPSPPPPLPPLFPPLSYSVRVTISVSVSESTPATASEVKSQLRAEISLAIDCDEATEDDCSVEGRSSQTSMQLVQISSFQISLSSAVVTEAQLVEIVQDALCGGRLPPACEAYQKGKPTGGSRRALATGEFEIDLEQVMADGDAMQVSTAAGDAAALAIYNGVIFKDATASVTATATGVLSTDAQVRTPHHDPTPTSTPTPTNSPSPEPPPRTAYPYSQVIHSPAHYPAHNPAPTSNQTQVLITRQGDSAQAADLFSSPSPSPTLALALALALAL
jgi:hypothetical protein